MTTDPKGNRDRPRRRRPAPALLLAAAAAAGGCATAAPQTPATLDELYLVGPGPARELGYRIDFQVQVNPHGGSGISQVRAEADSVFVLDGRNFLTRLRRDDGERLWRIPVADPLDVIHGITYLDGIERILVTVGGNLIVLDDDTGSMIDKQKLGQIASTEPVVLGSLLIYGARNGQLVWHAFDVGYQWKGYQVSNSIRLKPVLVGDIVAAIGADGRVMGLDAASAVAMWETQLLDGVVAEPAVGHGLLYIAGLDQYLRAVDLGTGRTVWRHLTEEPLRSPPALVGDRVYQPTADQGLVCFAADPADAPGGKVLWRAPEIHGRVIGARDEARLLVWDAQRKELAVVDGARGTVVTTVGLPAVDHLMTVGPEAAELYGAGDDGRVIRLVPRS